MNTKALAKHYANLTPEERFRLILAASGRSDEIERERLAKAGGRIVLSMPDHAPYAESLQEVALLTFIELLEDTSRYFEAFDRADDDFVAGFDDRDAAQELEGDADGDEAEQETEAATHEKSSKQAADDPRTCQVLFELVLAAGYTLRTKAEGWKLFCKRLNVAPFLLWQGLPGLDRMQRALALTEKAAFLPEDFLRWLNRIRAAGQPELLQVPFTAANVADVTEAMFRARVKWWSG